MVLYTNSIKSHKVWQGIKKKKTNQHLESHIIQSGTNKAIDSLGEIKRHHSYSIGYMPC